MSKSGGKRRARGRSAEGTEGGNEVAGGGTTPADPRPKPTVPERLLAKASATYETAKDVLAVLLTRGAPDPVVRRAQDFLVEADSMRGAVRELVESGWQPSEKREMKDLQVGDALALAESARTRYSFIPEGTKLVAGDIQRAANSRIKAVLLRENLPEDERVDLARPLDVREPRVFGWAQLSHLVRA